MIKKLTCHCGGVEAEVSLPSGLKNVLKCNCSICRLNDYEHLFINHDDFKIIKGEELISEYSFSSKTAKHLFCKKCGIKSFYQPRSHPDSYSINLKCVQEPPKINNVVKFDGKNEYE